jgi:hypothetical protein
VHGRRRKRALACLLLFIGVPIAQRGSAQEAGSCLTPHARSWSRAGLSRRSPDLECPSWPADSALRNRPHLAADNNDPSCAKVVGAFTLFGAGQGGLLGLAGGLTFDAVAAARGSHSFHLFTRSQAIGAAIGTSAFLVGAPLGAYIGCSDRKAHGVPILRALDSGASCPQRRGLDLVAGGLLGAGLAIGVVSSLELSLRNPEPQSPSGSHVWHDAGLATVPAVPTGIALGNLVWSRCLLSRFSTRR